MCMKHNNVETPRNTSMLWASQSKLVIQVYLETL